MARTLSVFFFRIRLHSRLVYNYCTTVQKSKNKSTNLGTGTGKSGGGGAELIGQELYKRLKNFLETYLIELLKVSHAVLMHSLLDADRITTKINSNILFFSFSSPCRADQI